MNNIIWEDATSTSGIKPGESWGAAWGDFNGDSYPDLWINYHTRPGILYLNQTDGTFVDVTNSVFLEEPTEDKHGTAWADFDNDGDRDLLQIVGGGSGFGIGSEFSNKLYVNEDGKLEDRASSLGVDYPTARGRGQLWFDYNNDGALDLLVGVIPRLDDIEAPPKIFQQ